ncbi:hypothetical protein V8G54_003838 [Vigna mungo]|uniref:Uncharacterized protein n=1 Tax=Vigna mungo TaxID=3915 RepID=A0AAQ3SEN4_VIGMU
MTKFEVRVPDKTGLRGQCGNWAYGPGETGLLGPGETGLMGPVWKLSLGANVETGLRGEASWVTRPVWKLGLGASVETGLRGHAETGLRGQCRNWTLGPVWKLGLGASVEIGLRGHVKTGLLGPGELGLGAKARLGLGVVDSLASFTIVMVNQDEDNGRMEEHTLDRMKRSLRIQEIFSRESVTENRPSRQPPDVTLMPPGDLPLIAQPPGARGPSPDGLPLIANLPRVYARVPTPRIWPPSGKLGLWASENWAWGPVWKLGLVGQCRNWAYGPMYKLDLWASVETGLRGHVETGHMCQMKLGLWAGVESGLRGQCRNWAYGPVKTGLGGQVSWALGPMWKLGLVGQKLGLVGQYGNWALGATIETGLRGPPIWKLGLWANMTIKLRGPVWKLGFANFENLEIRRRRVVIFTKLPQVFLWHSWKRGWA